MPDPVRVVVAGCGTITEKNHLPALAALGARVDVVGLVDPSEARLQICGELAPGALPCSSLDDAVRRLQPDEVVVASPSQFHHDQTITALDGGAHVLCEKPLGLTGVECAEMIDAATRHQRLLGAGLMRRGFPSVAAIRSLLRHEVLGRPTRFEVLEGFTFGWPVKSAHQFLRSGGGVLMDAGPHVIDLLTTWLGPLELVDYADDAIGGAEATCVLELRTTDGVPGTVRLTRELVLPNRQVIWCERGWVAYHYDVADRFSWGWTDAPSANHVVLAEPPADDPMWAWSDPANRVAGSLGQAFVTMHRNMVDAITTGAPLLVPATEAAAGIRLLEECLARRRLMEMPWLDADEQQRAHMIESAMANQ